MDHKTRANIVVILFALLCGLFFNACSKIRHNINQDPIASTSSPTKQETPRPKRSSTPFAATYDAQLLKPEVLIKNNSIKVIKLRLENVDTSQLAEDITMEVAPFSNKTITIPVGNYRYFASASNVKPATGENFFEAYYRYSWHFEIRTTTSQKP